MRVEPSLEGDEPDGPFDTSRFRLPVISFVCASIRVSGRPSARRVLPIRTLALCIMVSALPAHLLADDVTWSFSSALVNVEASDTFGRRFGHIGESVSLVLSAPSSGSDVSTAPDAIRASVAAGESEDVLLRVSSEEKGLSVSDVSVSPPAHVDGTALLQSELFVVGELRELEGKSLSTDSWPDPLLPLGDIDRPFVSSGGLRLALSVQTPSEAIPGRYNSKITIDFDHGTRIVVPLEITVWDIVLPRRSRVATQLFGLDERSIAYRYGLDPGGEALDNVLANAVSLMAEHRFSPASFVTGSGSSRSRTERTTEGSGELDFAGPAFETLGGSFRLGFELSVARERQGPILAHRWHNREAGYAVTMRAGSLSFAAGVREDTGLLGELVRAPTSEVRSISTPFPDDGMWHRVDVDVTRDEWILLVDGEERARERVDGAIVPAWGGWVSSDPPAGIEVRNLGWEPLDGVDGTPGSESPLAGRIAGMSSWGGETSGFRQHTGENTADASTWFRAHTNDLRRPGERDLGAALSLAAAVETDVADAGWFVSLPVDEAYDGAGAQRNIAFAKRVRAAEPDLPVFHTFGAMRGLGRSPASRLASLKRFAPHVDIFSVRPSVYFEQREFFEGRDVSLYVHDVNIVEREDVTLLGRSYFWKLDELGIDKTSFWNTTLWFQPEKPGRPERRIVDTPDGFAVTRRNPSGLGAGMIFYPGPGGLLPSLRSHAWRDGLEDSELLLMLRELAAVDGSDEDDVQAGSGASRRSAARKLLEQHETLFVDRGFVELATSWPTTLRTLRWEIGTLLSSASSDAAQAD